MKVGVSAINIYYLLFHVFGEGVLILRQYVGDGVKAESLVSEFLPHRSKVEAEEVFFTDLEWKKFNLGGRSSESETFAAFRENHFALGRQQIHFGGLWVM